MKKRFWKGPRPIDLVIIMTVFLLVSGIVIKRYDRFKCRALQSEAKFGLQEIYAAQQYFHAQNDRYAELGQLEKENRIVLPKKFYTFADLQRPSKDKFSVGALGVNDVLVAKEQWVVNEDGDPVLIKPSCSNE